MAYAAGGFVGGTLLIAILSWLVERFAFRQFPPMGRSIATVGAAWLIASIIAGFGYADGGPYAWQAWLYYVPSALVWWWVYHRGLVKRWNEEQDGFSETSE